MSRLAFEISGSAELRQYVIGIKSDNFDVLF